MNTATQLVKYIFESVYEDGTKDINWMRAIPISKALYTSDIAFFLCNYLIQLAFTGNIQWLLRPTDLVSDILSRIPTPSPNPPNPPNPPTENTQKKQAVDGKEG